MWKSDSGADQMMAIDRRCFFSSRALPVIDEDVHVPGKGPCRGATFSDTPHFWRGFNALLAGSRFTVGAPQFATPLIQKTIIGN
jgi:hypothetical protein